MLTGESCFYTIRPDDIGQYVIFAFGRKWHLRDAVSENDVGHRVYAARGQLHWEKSPPESTAYCVVENPAITSEFHEDTFGVFSYSESGGRTFHGFFASAIEAQNTYPQAEWHGYHRTGYVSR